MSSTATSQPYESVVLNDPFVMNYIRAVIFCFLCLATIVCIWYLNTNGINSLSSLQFFTPTKNSTATNGVAVHLQPDLKKSAAPGLDLKKFRLNNVTKAYEVDGKPILWQFWHSEDVPLYVSLLVEAMQCRNPEFHTILVHDSTIRHYLPDLNVSAEVYQSLSTNHRSDIFRVHIMYKYGGVYADVDTYALDKLYPWYRQLKDYDFVTANWGNVITALGVLGPVRARSRLFKIWTRNQIKIINKDFPSFSWGVFGPGAMDGFKEEIASNNTKYRGYDGYTTSGQLINVNLHKGSHLLFRDEEKKFIPLRSAPFLMVYGREIRQRYGHISTIDDLMPENPTVYSAFVGCALLDCWWKYEALIENKQNGFVNPRQIMKFLRRIDYETCEKIGQRKSNISL